jgi:hypothetical protein
LTRLGFMRLVTLVIEKWFGDYEYLGAHLIQRWPFNFRTTGLITTK